MADVGPWFVMASTVSWPTSEGFWVDFEASVLVDLPVKVSARELLFYIKRESGHSPVPAPPQRGLTLDVDQGAFKWVNAASSGDRRPALRTRPR